MNSQKYGLTVLTRPGIKTLVIFGVAVSAIIAGIAVPVMGEALFAIFTVFASYMAKEDSRKQS